MPKSTPKKIMKKDGKYLDTWKVFHDDSTRWYWRLRFWRLELMLTVHRHEYFDYPQYPPKRKKGSPDRWVFQPHLIYDRKRK